MNQKAGIMMKMRMKSEDGNGTENDNTTLAERRAEESKDELRWQSR